MMGSGAKPEQTEAAEQKLRCAAAAFRFPLIGIDAKTLKASLKTKTLRL